MSKIEVELTEDLGNWLRSYADRYGFTLAQMLEHLVALESGLRCEDALGRRIRVRDMTYRQLTPPGEPFAAAGYHAEAN
jgi:hypothetical protein